MQEMKLIEYMYRSQIPQLFKIIDMYNKCIELRRTLIGRQHQVVYETYYLGLERYWHWVIGYWVLSNICRYWVVLLLGDIFFIVTPNMIPDSSQHRPHDNHLDICGVDVASKGRQGEWGGVECKLYIVIIQF